MLQILYRYRLERPTQDKFEVDVKKPPIVGDEYILGMSVSHPHNVGQHALACAASHKGLQATLGNTEGTFGVRLLSS